MTGEINLNDILLNLNLDSDNCISSIKKKVINSNIKTKKSDKNIAFLDDKCECGSLLITKNLERECIECGAIYDAVNDVDLSTMNQNNYRLTITGKDSNLYQSNLDKSNPINTAGIQLRNVSNELLKLNEEFEDSGNRPFPISVLNNTSKIYNVLFQQAHKVRRSQRKFVIIGSILEHQCMVVNSVRRKEDIKKLLGLKTCNLASGRRILTDMCESNGLPRDIDYINPQIETVFICLNFTDDKYKFIKDITLEMIDVSENKNIGIQSKIKTKVISIMYIVFNRANIPITLKTITEKCEVGSTSISKFINVLYDWHSHFKDIYQKYELNDDKDLILH